MAMMQNSLSRSSIIASLLTGLTIGLSWVWPGTLQSVLLGWLSAFCIVYSIRRTKLTSIHWFCVGILAFITACPWAPEASAVFTETSPPFGFLVSIPLVGWHGIQLILFKQLYRYLPEELDRYSLRCALAWVVTEGLWVRIFDWKLGHTQFSFLPFIQSAEFVGVSGLTFLLLVIASAVEELAHNSSMKRALLTKATLPLFVSPLLLLYGYYAIDSYSGTDTQKIRVGLVQVELRNEDTEPFPRLKSMTELIPDELDLVVWPEGSSDFNINESITHVDNDSRIPKVEKDTPILFGSGTFRPPRKRFKSVFLMESGGALPLPYHKVNYVPIAEKTLFKETLTDLGLIERKKSFEFTPGKEQKVFSLSNKDNSHALVSPLVCYEDMNTTAARNSVAQGAQVLTSHSAAQWITSERALEQHFLIAAFRAVELRRTLIRSTGGARSAIILPTGAVATSLPYHQDTFTVAEVPLQNTKTIYLLYGDLFLWLLSALSFCLVIASRFSLRAGESLSSPYLSAK